jgi:polyhydroxyalkanoate synthesis regulator phasin
MAQLDAIRKYLEAGMAFTQTTRARAEEVVSNLVRAGELQSEQTQQQVQELVDRSRENTERLITAVRSEVMDQLSSLGFATKADLAKLERKVDGLRGTRATSATKKATKKATTAKKAGAKKASTKKASTKKAPAKKAAKASKKAPATKG